MLLMYTTGVAMLLGIGLFAITGIRIFLAPSAMVAAIVVMQKIIRLQTQEVAGNVAAQAAQLADVLSSEAALWFVVILAIVCNVIYALLWMSGHLQPRADND